MPDKNSKNRRFWSFTSLADHEAELLLLGVIAEQSWFGDEITPRMFNDDLAALGNVKSIKVHIHSPGGDVFAGVAIYNALKNHPAQITAYIDGIAASVASMVAMAGDTIIMPRTAEMMIHNPYIFTVGDANELRVTADILDKIRDSMMAAYIDKTGIDEKELVAMLNAETWMTAQEAVDLGFADEIDEQRTVIASIRGKMLNVNGLDFDLRNFKLLPVAMLVDWGKETDMGKGKPKGESDEPVAVEAEGGELRAESTEAEGTAEGGEQIAESTEGTETPDAPANVADPVAAERRRIVDIQELAVAGAEDIIARAIESGADPRDVALEIVRSESVRNAVALQARGVDASGAVVAPGGDLSESPVAKKTGLLVAALKKLRGG